MNAATLRPHVTVQRRGAIAALFFALVVAATGVPAVASGDNGSVAPFQTQFADGLTLVARTATASPTAALQIWIRCPSNGYGEPRPGIARLAALSVVETKAHGMSLRDEARRVGAQITVSVYQESTEIAILAPAYLSASLLDGLMSRVLNPHLDQAAFDAARTRLAAQQVAASDAVDQALRDALFSYLFSSGPLHDSTYGDPQTLRNLSLADASAFASRAYVPASEIVVAVGSVNRDEVVKRVGAAAPPPAAAQRMPDSELAATSNAPIPLAQRSPEAGLAMGWAGPPIEDQRAATAMDFMSDYLARPADGVLAKAVHAVNATASFNGQFITMRKPGVFFVTASGQGFDPALASPAINNAIGGALRRPLSQRDFDRARDAFVTHLLSDMQTAQGLADNYGWYFAQGALSYSPSATDTALSGEYFQRVASLTPEYVSEIARRYLLNRPVTIVLPARTGTSGAPVAL